MDFNGKMWIGVNFKIAFYQPEILKPGMWFINSLYPGSDKEFVELWELKEVISRDQYEEFYQKNGFPVEILFTIESDNPDDPDEVIVFHEEIGWVYDIENDSKEPVNIKHLNSIIADYGSNVFLLIDEEIYEEEGLIDPYLVDGKVVFTYPFEEEDEEE